MGIYEYLRVLKLSMTATNPLNIMNIIQLLLFITTSSEKLNVSTTYLHDIPHVVDTELVCRGDNGYKGGFPHDILNPCRGIQCAHDTPPRHAKCNPRHASTTCYPRHGALHDILF